MLPSNTELYAQIQGITNSFLGKKIDIITYHQIKNQVTSIINSYLQQNMINKKFVVGVYASKRDVRNVKIRISDKFLLSGGLK